jgi:hypothetical protein
VGLYYVVAVVVPLAVGAAALWFSQRRPALGLRPAVTAMVLFVVLVVLNALDSPGGDLVAPTIGGIVSVAVSVVVYIVLRRRLASTVVAPGR